MPERKINYLNTIIYKIVCKDLAIKDAYVGSTTSFTNRKLQHKTSCSYPSCKSYSQKKYTVMRQNGGWENWDMIEVEKFPCADGNEARSRERYWYEVLNASMNDRKPLRSKEESAIYNRQYLHSNKAELKEKRDLYRDKIKDDPEYKRKNIERANAYRQANITAILTKEKTSKTTCACGSTYRSRDKSQHIKCSKHQVYIIQNENKV